MAPRTKPKTLSSKRPSRKNRIAKRTTTTSPKSKSKSKSSLINALRKNSRKARRRDIQKDFLTDKTYKYSRSVLPASSEPLEKNIYERDPMPAEYIFVPKGDVYITRHCRRKTKESRRIVYVVYDPTNRPLGLRVPASIHARVLHSAAETAPSRAAAVQLRDDRDRSHARQLLRNLFPLMPEASLAAIVQHAFLKGSGRVGRSTRQSDARKAGLAVEAHIRHAHTPYEELLRAGVSRGEAREAVWETVKGVKRAWEGMVCKEGGCQQLVLRDKEKVVIELD